MILLLRVDDLLDHCLDCWISIIRNPHTLQQIGHLVHQAAITCARRPHACLTPLVIINIHRGNVWISLLIFLFFVLRCPFTFALVLPFLASSFPFLLLLVVLVAVELALVG